MRVGLSGGVGSGKSTVAAMLVGHGAVLIDADAIAREVVEPGTAGYEAVVARFGAEVVADGRLDRPALAKVVFSDDQARLDLNAIVHPLVGERVGELMEQAPADAIVIYDVPLLIESDAAAGFDVVVIVMASPSVRLERLAERGMGEGDARARMAAQASDEQRRAVADEIITNDGTKAELTEQVNGLWQRLLAGEARKR